MTGAHSKLAPSMFRKTPKDDYGCDTYDSDKPSSPTPPPQGQAVTAGIHSPLH